MMVLKMVKIFFLLLSFKNNKQDSVITIQNKDFQTSQLVALLTNTVTVQKVYLSFRKWAL